jgi:hypothetical protein
MQITDEILTKKHAYEGMEYINEDNQPVMK